MKKLITLFAFLACFLGAKAVEIDDFKVDYTEKGKSTIGWKADMIQDDWITADEDGLHLFNPEVTEHFYDYQLWIFNGADLEVDVNYTVKIVAKVSDGEATVRCRVGDWNGGIAGDVIVNSTDYQEYTLEGKATVASSGLLVQFGDYVGTVSFKSVTITHDGKVERPVEWIELLTNGNAETPWTDAQKSIKFNDTDNNYTICAWSKEKGVNLNDDNGSDPFVATIVEDPTDPTNHVFLCDGQPATTDGDASAWDNQFWIEAPRQIKAGEQVKIHFRYMASEAANTNTQIHHQNPSDYMHWQAINDVAFTTEWQTYDQVVTWPSGGDDKGWSIAFNLNAQNKNAVKFYFDDLSIQEMKLDRGLYVAAANTKTGDDYDFDNATEFVYDADLAAYVATVGTAGKQDTWVNQVMISTVRGNDRMFKANTIKMSSGTIDGTEDAWLNFTDGSNAKIDLPAAGVWRIAVDTENNQANFLLIEGEELVVKEPVDIVTNTTEFVINAVERDWKPADNDGNPVEEGIGTGQPWDNQFWIAANRDLEKDEVTVIKFKYKSSVDARTSTQDHKMGDDGKPCTYMHWDAIGDVNFAAGDWVDFEKEFKVPGDANGMRSITFNMAEIKGACDYYIKDVQWFLKYDEVGKTMENLINAEGTENFYIKIGAGTAPYQYGTDPETDGINSVVTNNNASAVIYNLAGQRVDNGYKGIVVKSGKKVMMK